MMQRQFERALTLVCEMFGKNRKGQETEEEKSKLPCGASLEKSNGEIVGFPRVRLPNKYVKRFESPAEENQDSGEARETLNLEAGSSCSKLSLLSHFSYDENIDDGARSYESSDQVLSFETLDDDICAAEKQMLPNAFENMIIGSSMESLTSSAFDLEKVEDDDGEDTWKKDGTFRSVSSKDEEYTRSKTLENEVPILPGKDEELEITMDSPDPDGGYFSKNTSQDIVNPVLKCKADEDLENWDPMGAFYESTRNIKCFDAETTLKGIPHFRGAICPYSDDQACYKGDRCPCEHHIDRRKVAENPKMALPVEPQRITHFSILPPKIKAELGACFFAKITCVNAVNDFYFSPLNGVACECKKHDRDYAMRAKDGHCTLDMITAEMNAYFSKHSAKYASSYGFMELAAVRINYRGEFGYYRAAVLENTVVDSDDYPESPCYLVDLGHRLNIKMNLLQILPKMFCSVPPLAYRCSLNGVSPLQAWGHGKSQDNFIGATEGRQVLIKITRVCWTEDVSAFCYTESIPHFGDVFVWDEENNRFHSIVQELIDSKTVLPWATEYIEAEEEKIKCSPNCYDDGNDTAGCYHDEEFEFIRRRYYSKHGIFPPDEG